MFFNTRSLSAAALLAVCVLEASALDFKPITDPTQIIPPNQAGNILKRTDLKPIADPTELLPGQAGQAFKRDAGPAPIDLLPIDDPTVLTHGRSLRRAVAGKEAFDPKNATTFYWGAYAGDNIYVANFTLSNPFDDEFILPVEQFAKELKSIKCGEVGAPMILEFKDQDSYDYAESGWDWVNKEDINKFTLVTEPDQCYKGDNRSPYLVSNIVFDKKTLTANIKAEEKEWSELAHTFDLHLRHQHVPRATANVTHPHLMRRENSDMDIGHSFNGQLFDFAIDSLTTMGMALSASAEITTAGHIAADFDIQQKKILGIPTVPEDIKIKIQPQDVTALMKLTLHADGTLGKGIDWSMTPEIDIPIAALNIAKILQIGPFVTIGVHFGSSALSGTGDIVTGAKGSFSNDAEVSVMLRKPEDNSFTNWQPTIEKIDPVFSAEFTGDLEAWAELAVVIKAEALGKWGYQAGIEAELPYFRADLLANKDPAGVCGTMKTVGIDIDTSVGIDVSLQAGRVNAVADFRKDLFTTSWPLFTTCMAIGDDNAVTATATETEIMETGEPTAIVTGTEVVETGEPTATDGGEADIPVETEFPTAIVTDEPMITDMPSADMPGETIYKTVYVTRGGADDVPSETEIPSATDEASLPEETELPIATDEAPLPIETELPTATDEPSVPEETELPIATDEASLPEETELPTATDEPSLPEETEFPTATAADVLPEETELPTATDEPSLPEETEFPTATAAGALPEESLPANTTADGKMSMLPIETSDPTAPIETSDPTAPIETSDPTAPIETSDPTAPMETAKPTTIIASPSIGYPQMNSTIVSVIGTAPPSTFATIVASSMAKPFTPGQVETLPTPPPFPQNPSVPTASSKMEYGNGGVPVAPKPSVPADAPSYSYRFLRRS